MILKDGDIPNVGLVESIEGNIESTNKFVKIVASGRNLIIVGANGSGKTSFLRGVFKSLTENIVNEHFFGVESYRYNVEIATNLIADDPKSPNNAMYESSLKHNQKLLDSVKYPFVLEFNDPEKFRDLYKARLAVISIFEADRKAAIRKVTSATGRPHDISDLGIDSNYGVNLEQYLVNLEVRSGFAMRKNDINRVSKVSRWFELFVENLKYLFENELLELEFDDERLCFFIVQPGRPKYSFQTLSSGYLAIFDIYADLLMRAEYHDITPFELQGVVLIDEIDAHLHISLQRKILPFLIASFPNIQFIITTHSPFVVTSVDDALIYDISTGKECDDLW